MIKYCISDFKTIIKNDNFKDDLKKNIKSNGIVFIPSDPSNLQSTKKYGNEIITEFMNKGIIFDNILYISDRHILNNLIPSLNDYDLVFLMGGKTKVQNKFLNSIDFDRFFNEYDGLVIGQSAGALNLCKKVYLSPTHGENDKIEYLKGLGLIEQLIEVHFNINDKKQTSFLHSSKNEVICISDNAAVRFDGNVINYYGDVYNYKDGTYDKLEVVE